MKNMSPHSPMSKSLNVLLNLLTFRKQILCKAIFVQWLSDFESVYSYWMCLLMCTSLIGLDMKHKSALLKSFDFGWKFDWCSNKWFVPLTLENKIYDIEQFQKHFGKLQSSYYSAAFRKYYLFYERTRRSSSAHNFTLHISTYW